MPIAINADFHKLFADDKLRSKEVKTPANSHILCQNCHEQIFKNGCF